MLWGLLGAGIAVFLLITQANALGSYASVLQVGEDSELASYISTRLPDLNLMPGVGNDGSIYFAIGSDLRGSTVPSLIPSPGLRYRRIAYPLLASFGGLLDGRGLLVGMITVVVASASSSLASLMAMAARFNLPRWVAFGLIGNFGWVLGIRLLTPDPLGIALMLAGIGAALGDRPAKATLFLAGAALTKEPYYVAALAVAMWLWTSRRRRWALASVITPLAPVAIWTAILHGHMGGFNTGSHLDWPIMGVVKGAAFWAGAPTKDHAYSALALVSLGLAIGGGFVAKAALLRWLSWGWAGVGLISSDWIWKFGNASLRVLAPCLLFGLLCVASLDHRSSEQRTESFDPAFDIGRAGN
ncbi:MAG: hypothetical protein JJE47_05890 [Acidimicrobiia bacterium]|nr:hypothetical protein [Acidimicrobiia bacterium]